MKTILDLHRVSTRFDNAIGDWGGSLLTLALRFFVASQFFRAGLSKACDWGATMALFHNEYQVPLLSPGIAAGVGTAGELIFPLLLFAGLLSRPAAIALFCVNVAAVVSYPQLFSFDCPAAINDHFYWGAILLVLIAFGPGRFSVDHVLAIKHAESLQEGVRSA